MDLAFEHRRNHGRNSVRVVKENMEKEGAARDIPWVHQVCGKSHKKGDCTYVCYGCKQIGSHKPEACWELHPQLKPARLRKKEERYRYRERSKSREGGEGNRKRRENNPHPNRNSSSVRRIANRSVDRNDDREDNWKK